MGIKSVELASPQSCLNKALPDEPLFVLRAKDPLAPQAIRHWATMSAARQPHEKLMEARRVADEMDAYRASRFPEPQCAPPEESARG